MTDLRKAAAIVGAYEHPIRYAPDKSEMQVQAEAIIGALEDAGLEKKDVDAFFCASSSPTGNLMGLLDYLNLNPRYFDSTGIGGASFLSHTGHALSAIATGKARCAVIVYGELSRSRGVAVGTGGAFRRGVPTVHPYPDSFEEPYGTTVVGLYAMVAQRHMHQYGTRPEQLAAIAVACRRHAQHNPHAMFRDPIAIEDVLSSRMVSSPLHVLDCCVISDGAGAIIVASPEVARSARKRPVWVLGHAEHIAHTGGGLRDLTTIAAAHTGKAALEMAGVTHGDIDMAMIYDSFTITVLCTLEDLGFCQKGEGGAFVEGGRIELGGKLPINTDGGGLSSNHPGHRSIFLLIEAARQLRHDFAGTPRQVPDCKLALCHGTGYTIGTRHSGVTLVLGRD
ncbi:MAG: thiolase domain-containing protein [Chloroflexi bacterium]|nr:thiolase domain-containing protein [Chloroflexota bacterium]